MLMHRMFVLTLAAAATLAAGSLPHTGKWKMNPAKSDFGETTMAVADLGSGEMQFSTEGQSYKFKLDGKDYPGLFGQTAAWKQIDSTTWEETDKLNGKVLSTGTYKLSPDGKSLTARGKMLKPEGGDVEETVVYKRESGGPGLPGKWKTKNYKTSSPALLEMVASDEEGLKLTMVDFKLTCEAKFDGKEHPCTGPTIAQGWTMSAKKTGPRTVEVVNQLNGKPMFEAAMTVSTDGKTLTEHGSATGSAEKYKAVYDRQ
jgi:hypothetical protein